MGFFSFKTTDTDRSISNTFSVRGTFPVKMVDNKGHIWEENEYEGYGIFGGKDYYTLLAEMNGFHSEDNEEARSVGISTYFDKNFEIHKIKGSNIIYPQLYENEVPPLEEINFYERPDDCEFQGYFYDDEDDEI